MMSAPASAWTSAWLDQHLDRLVVDHVAASVDQPVLPVAGVGIERDVGEHADLRRRMHRSP